MNDTNDYPERPHPGDTTPAETRTIRRRIALGVLIAASLNLGFLAGGAAIANYVAAIFRPIFFKKDTIVYVKLDATPAPAPSPSVSSSPASPTQ
ncbi:MAG: hypothetical protein H7Y38_02550 [Armatimonadetes bacterium]|nr:hypothetical protein [Armatimonadota bacterium]